MMGIAYGVSPITYAIPSEVSPFRLLKRDSHIQLKFAFRLCRVDTEAGFRLPLELEHRFRRLRRCSEWVSQVRKTDRYPMFNCFPLFQALPLMPIQWTGGDGSSGRL